MTDTAASVRGRLTSLSKAQGVPLQRLLQRYVNERIVYRLGTSVYRDTFVLKGAMLFVLWADEPHRATKDLDLLGKGELSEERLRQIFHSILETPPLPADGLVFDTEKLSVAPIREDKRYGKQLAALGPRHPVASTSSSAPNPPWRCPPPRGDWTHRRAGRPLTCGGRPGALRLSTYSTGVQSALELLP